VNPSTRIRVKAYGRIHSNLVAAKWKRVSAPIDKQTNVEIYRRESWSGKKEKRIRDNQTFARGAFNAKRTENKINFLLKALKDFRFGRMFNILTVSFIFLHSFSQYITFNWLTLSFPSLKHLLMIFCVNSSKKAS
jgi:hypothetical protein